MINVSDEVKQAYDVNTTQVDKIILNEQEYRITNVEYYDDVYNEGNIFGTAIGKCLEFEIENIVDLEGQEVEYQTGIIVNGITQWISLGNFIIQDIEPNDTTNIVKVSAMDYMLKSNILYESSLNYGDGTVTLLDVLQEVCTNSGITLATMEFTNSTFIVDSNQFADGTLNRQVIQAVAQISGTIAKIKNNQLHLIGPATTISKVFTLNNYEEAEIKRATHPINLVSLGMADIEGENIVLRDEASIATNGENSLVINDNPFAYTQAKRELLITALFDAVKGFEYKAFSFKCQGLPYLETMDKVQFLDKEGNTYDSYVFRYNYKSPSGLESTIEAPSVTRAVVTYQNVPSALDIAKRAEIIVDKQNQTIQSVVSQTDAQNQKISVVEQTVNELNSKIGDIADITTSQETLNGTLSFEKINQSEPIYIKIYPTGTNIMYLYPRDNLYPSDTLYPTGRTLRFTNTTTEEYIDYELPTDLLYYDTENYDEFILDYDAQSCVVNKRVGYNADGTTYVLESVKTIDYEYPRIELIDGDYVITLLGYHNAYLFVRLMAQNIYTTQFATKAEVNSEISQTAQQINLEVSKKVGNDEIISKINQSAEAVQIDANKINLNGKEINLTSDNTTIKSTNFNVDKNGNMTCNNATMNNANIIGGIVEVIGGEDNQSSTGLKLKAVTENSTYQYGGIAPQFAIIRNNLNTYISSQVGSVRNPTSQSAITTIQGQEGSYVSLVSIGGGSSVNVVGLTSATYINQSGIETPVLTQTSKESKKKNITKYNEKALDIIKNSEIYEYNFKSEDKSNKKHIGFVIGDEGGEYKTPERVISNDREGIDTYSMTSILWKAMQEQQAIIEQLQNEIKELKGEK